MNLVKLISFVSLVSVCEKTIRATLAPWTTKKEFSTSRLNSLENFQNFWGLFCDSNLIAIIGLTDLISISVVGIEFGAQS